MNQPKPTPPERKFYLMTIRIEPAPIHISRVVIASSLEEAERHAASLSTSVVEEFYVEGLQAILDARDDNRDLVRRFQAQVVEGINVGKAPIPDPQTD